MRKLMFSMTFMIILIIVLSALSFAAEKQQVKTGTYKQGDTIRVHEDLIMKVAEINNQHAVTLDIDEERAKISDGDCIRRNGYEICLTAVQQSSEKHPRFDIYLYEYTITIYKDISRVTINQAAEKTKM